MKICSSELVKEIKKFMESEEVETTVKFDGLLSNSAFSLNLYKEDGLLVNLYSLIDHTKGVEFMNCSSAIHSTIYDFPQSGSEVVEIAFDVINNLLGL